MENPIRSLRTYLLGAALLVSLVGMTTARAQMVYNLADGVQYDYTNTTDTASDVWQFGTLSYVSGNPVPGTVGTAGVAYTNPAGNLEDINVTSDANVVLNPTTSSSYTGFASVWNPGAVLFGPFGGPTVAQFTAPAAGLYDISASFTTDQTSNASPIAYVYVGAANELTYQLIDPSNAQFGTPKNFTDNSVALIAGETIDFVVYGGDTNNKNTQVDATVTELPEPSTYAMMLAGLALLGFCVRRKAALLS
jgi:hypothetical protein